MIYRCARHQRGFTIIELVTVMLILAVVSTMAAPRFRDLLINQRLASTASDLVAALNSARNEAIKKSATTVVSPADDGGWDNGWKVTSGTGSSAVTLMSYEKPPSGIVRDTSLGNGFANAVTFDSNGFARDADGKFGGSGCLTFKADTHRRISIIVSSTGRPRSCDPDKSGDCGSGDCNTAG